MQLSLDTSLNQFSYFPGTRYMGSKNKIVDKIWFTIKDIHFDSFLDAFAGSNVISYYMKCRGKEVISNDFMQISFMVAKAIVENNHIKLEQKDIDFLLNNPNLHTFIATQFKDLYFNEEENCFLDKVRSNISLLDDEYKQALAISALVRACMKKRPRGIFTYVGHRYDDGRQDIKKSLQNHFMENIAIFNSAVFDNKKLCKASNKNTENLKQKADLVYLDPPYFTPNSDNDYVRRYHFVEGLARNWEHLEIQEHTKTKKFKSFYSPFSKKDTTYQAFEQLIDTYKESTIVISYSSNSFPSKEELLSILSRFKSKVEIHEIDYTYSFGNQNHKQGNEFNRVKEYIFIGQD